MRISEDQSGGSVIVISHSHPILIYLACLKGIQEGEPRFECREC